MWKTGELYIRVSGDPPPSSGRNTAESGETPDRTRTGIFLHKLILGEPPAAPEGAEARLKGQMGISEALCYMLLQNRSGRLKLIPAPKLVTV